MRAWLLLAPLLAWVWQLGRTEEEGNGLSSLAQHVINYTDCRCIHSLLLASFPLISATGPSWSSWGARPSALLQLVLVYVLDPGFLCSGLYQSDPILSPSPRGLTESLGFFHSQCCCGFLPLCSAYCYFSGIWGGRSYICAQFFT